MDGTLGRIWLESRAFIARRVDDRPNVDDPAHKDEPEEAGQDELNGGGEEATLDELSQSRNEEAADGGDDVAGGTLAGHGAWAFL